LEFPAAVAERSDANALSPQRRLPGRRNSPSISWIEPFPIETGRQASRPPQAARARDDRFNRNFRRQEIAGEA
jgi:hypothetical protein